MSDDEHRLLELSSDLHASVQFQKLECQLGGGLQVVTEFSTLFAQWETSGDDLLVQVFPRAGEEDEFFEGQYLNRCANCRAETEARTGVYKKCRRCGHHGLIFNPGRLEAKAEHVEFPSNMIDHIKAACHKMWMGDVMGPDYVEELGAWVVKFLMVKCTRGTQPDEHLDRFLNELDRALDN